MQGNTKSFTSTKCRMLGTSDPGGALKGSSDANVTTTPQGIGSNTTYTGAGTNTPKRAYYNVRPKNTASYAKFDAR